MWANGSDYFEYLENEVKIVSSNSSVNSKVLRDLYHIQSGKCYYCGLSVKADCLEYSKSYDRVCVSKFVPKNGYTPNNIILTCLLCKLIKHTYKNDDMVSFISSLITSKLPSMMFTPDPNWALKVSNTCKKQSQHAGFNKGWVINQYHKQQGICYFTGLLLTPTADRLCMYRPTVVLTDPEREFIPDNCVIACLGISRAFSHCKTIVDVQDVVSRTDAIRLVSNFEMMK
jgi:hypothetical protein